MCFLCSAIQSDTLKPSLSRSCQRVTGTDLSNVKTTVVAALKVARVSFLQHLCKGGKGSLACNMQRHRFGHLLRETD
jgi:hypothetical protein